MADWKRVLLETDITQTVSENNTTTAPSEDAVFDAIAAAVNGLTSNDGTVTSVTAGAGMTQTGTSTVNPTLNVIGGDGITVGTDEIEATVDDVTIQLSATTGSGAITAKTAAVTTGGTALATGDQIYDFVTGITNGLSGADGTVTSVTGDDNITVASGTTDAVLSLETGLTSMVSMTGVDVAAGTGDGAGGDLTFNGGVGTGTGVGGDIFFKVAPPAASTANTQNAVATAVTIAAPTTATGDSTVTIHGDLVVNGTSSSIDVQTLTVEDASILLADGANSEATADGAGLTVDTITATPANHPDFIWKHTNLGVAGWQFKDHGAPTSAGSAPMGVAALTKGTANPSSAIMPTGSMWYNTGTVSGTKGLYIYVD